MANNNQDNRTVKIKIVGKIYEIVQMHPELRLCQILSIAAKEVGWSSGDLFYLSDAELLNGLTKLAEKEK